MKHFSQFILLLLFFSINTLHAQDVEPWEDSFDNGGITSYVYCSKVSFDYPDHYPMLFGWPDSSYTEYDMRDYLTGLAINMGMDAIIVCPDPANITTYNQLEDLIMFAYNGAVQGQKIDTNKIIITGDLHGGRFAYQLGLGLPDMFNGIIGVSPIMTKDDFEQDFLDNIGNTCIATIVGSMDNHFSDVDALVPIFQENNRRNFYSVLNNQDYNSYGYSTEFYDAYKNCIDFILDHSDDPEIRSDSAAYDLGLIDVATHETIDIVLSNSGREDLTISGITISENDEGAFDFVLGHETPIIIHPGQEHNLKIGLFTALEDHLYTSVASFESDAANAIVYTVDLAAKSGTEKTPLISVAHNSLDFGDVLVDGDNSLDLNITNTGESRLNIHNAVFKNNVDEAFSLGSNVSIPLLIEPTETGTITIQFNPKSGLDYNAILEMTSNAQNNPVVDIQLSGKGILSSVEEGMVRSNNGLLSLSVAPNPILDNSVISYTLNGEKRAKINLSIVDMNGRTIAELMDNEQDPGEYQLRVTPQGISSGVYYLRGSVYGSHVIMPIVFNK